MRNGITLIVLLTVTACGAPDEWNGSLEDRLRSEPDRFATVMADPEKHRVQIIYTQIDRDATNMPAFRSFSYRLDADEYFYPASTVKLPTAALALEKLSQLDVRGLDRDSVMLTGATADFHTEALYDDTSPTGLPSVAQYIKKILVVSDNEAFNRLYEFIGQQALNEALRDKGYEGIRIVHRLEVALDEAQNRWTNPVSFRSSDTIVYRQADVRSEVSFAGSEPEPLGVAEMVNGERIEGPKDFSTKNAYPLLALHDTVKALMFPDAVPESRRFALNDDDYRFMRRYMSAYPSEAQLGGFADGNFYPDGYVKFLMYGGAEADIPEHIRVFNKVGDAYGFLTDAAYIVDFDNQVEFLLAATVYTNANQTFNDDNYEYDEIGLPFLRDLGQSIYELELERPREHRPDLSALRTLRD